MINKLILSSLCCLNILATTLYGDYSTSSSAQRPTVQLKIEELSSEMKDWGLSKDKIEEEILNVFQQEDILISAQSNHPTFIVRVKGSEVKGHLCATVLQVMLMDEAELIRNKAKVMALMWSESSLLISLRESYTQDVLNALSPIVKSACIDLKRNQAAFNQTKDSKEKDTDSSAFMNLGS